MMNVNHIEGFLEDNDDTNKVFLNIFSEQKQIKGTGNVLPSKEAPVLQTTPKA